MTGGRVFIVWAPHSRRAETMAHELKAEIQFFHWKFRRRAYAPLKYPILGIRTLKFLFKSRPRMILAQSPPIFCPLICQFYSRFCSSQVIIDAHTGVWKNPWARLFILSMWMMRKASLTIYHDHYATRLLKSWSVKALFLEDRVPVVTASRHLKRGKQLRLVFVSTFAEDEPTGEVLGAAQRLPSVEFYITGNIAYAKPEYLRSHPPNVTFTGYLPEQEYFALLSSSDGVIVLTMAHYKTELSGCYEALAVGKPIITSDSAALRSTFSLGTIHVNNTAESIAHAIRHLATHRQRLSREIRLLKKRKEEEWNQAFARLEAVCLDAETGKVGLS